MYCDDVSVWVCGYLRALQKPCEKNGMSVSERKRERVCERAVVTIECYISPFLTRTRARMFV